MKGTTTWERLAELKESNPVEVAEYSVASGIDSMPAFKWWVPYTLKKRKRIITAVNKRVLKKTHKFGIRVPRTVEEALRIDLENGNTLWEDALNKEMGNVRVPFDIYRVTAVTTPGTMIAFLHLPKDRTRGVVLDPCKAALVDSHCTIFGQMELGYQTCGSSHRLLNQDCWFHFVFGPIGTGTPFSVPSRLAGARLLLFGQH
jgi:hypothetical protein